MTHEVGIMLLILAQSQYGIMLQYNLVLSTMHECFGLDDSYHKSKDDDDFACLHCIILCGTA